MNKKNKIIISITGIVLVLLILVGLTYGYYLTRISGNTSDKSISIDMANLELTYSDGNGLIEAKSIIPGETIATKTFTVKNTGNAKVSNYVVYLDSVVNNFEDKNDLKLTLTCTSDIGNCNGTNITYPSTNIMLVTNDIEEKETQSYELKVEFIETNDNQSDNMNKEMSGNILIKDIKGLNSTLETVTGTNELVVENAKLLSNYRIYGNSVQETRSGKNLWNVGTYQVSDSTSRSVKYDFLTTTNDWIRAGITYTLSTDIVLYEDDTRTNPRIQINAILDDGTESILYRKDLTKKATFSKVSIPFTIPTNKTVTKITVRLFDYSSNVASPTVWHGEAKNIQLEKGSTATEYEEYGAMPSPEYPSEIKSVGDLVTDTNDANYGKYKIPIKVTGDNLYDLSKISTGNMYDENGKIVSNSEIFLSDYMNIDSNNLVISGINIAKSQQNLRVNFFDDDKWISQIVILVKSQENFEEIIEVPDNAIKMNFSFALSNASSKGNINVKSLNITNIYLIEPLRKIGEYSDYIDFKSGKIIRNVKVNDNTGTKTISESFSKLNMQIEEKISLPTITLNSIKNYISIDTTTSPSNTELEVIK